MTVKQIQKILKDTAYQRISGYESELKAAEYLKAYCEQLGVAAHLESFPVDMADMEEAHLYADGKEIPCEGYLSCGSGEIYDGSFTKTLIARDGVTAELLKSNNITVLGESNLATLD